MHFFITGHTGFKGAWLTVLLRQLGHKVSGLALDPPDGGLFELAKLETEMESHVIADIRDFNAVKSAIKEAKPDFAIHMAAQPLVLKSYEEPLETFTTNVDGTLNFLRSVGELTSPPQSLVVTTDKVYRDDDKGPYLETDPLGGHDPYSSSKAMADILTQSWASTRPDLLINVARAGNVIGLFDVSSNRVLADVRRAQVSGSPMTVRNPKAIRPWQHVLDCLSGYVLLVTKSRGSENFPTVFNFGPRAEDHKSVSELIAKVQGLLPDLKVQDLAGFSAQKETDTLVLDSARARKLLGWNSLIGFDRAVEMSLVEVAPNQALEVARAQVEELLLLGASKWLRT